MKTISIRQPWASVICSGLKHVENRTWDLKNLPMRLLIHVGATKINKYDKDDYLPEEWVSLMRNARTMGLLPETKDLPYSSIIGWADVVRCDEPGKNTSDIWAQNEVTGWVLENVHIFDKPIPNVKGKLGLFDYPIDEDNMPPSRPAVFKDPDVDGDNVTMPVNDKLWKDLNDGSEDCILYDLTDDNIPLFVDEEGNYKQFKTITITNNGNKATFSLLEDSDVYFYLNENGEKYTFKSLAGEEGYEWAFVQFVIGSKNN